MVKRTLIMRSMSELVIFVLERTVNVFFMLVVHVPLDPAEQQREDGCYASNGSADDRADMRAGRLGGSTRRGEALR
jgi:hypothetical protein